MHLASGQELADAQHQAVGAGEHPTGIAGVHRQAGYAATLFCGDRGCQDRGAQRHV
jgi:hypothetical protein